MWKCIHAIFLYFSFVIDITIFSILFQVSPVFMGQHVWAKHKNGRFYKGTVVVMEKKLFYWVVFEDGSFSDDLYPEDVVVSTITTLKAQSRSEEIQVCLWSLIALRRIPIRGI